jgi:hypothetical protein
VTFPVLGTSNPAKILNKVLFPDPEVPVMATLSPASISKQMSCKILRAPSLDETLLPRWLALRTLLGILINESN